MRFMMTIDHMTLSSKMEVNTVDYEDGRLEKARVDQFIVERSDAEYQLLAQAIDRFATVMRNRSVIESQARLLDKVDQ